MPSQRVIVELSQHLCASISDPWYIYALVVAQDPLGTLVPLSYIVAALRAPLRCRLGTMGPWGFCPGLPGLGPWGFRPSLFGLGSEGFCPGLFAFGSQGLCLGFFPLSALWACCAPLSPSGSFLLLCELLPVTSR